MNPSQLMNTLVSYAKNIKTKKRLPFLNSQVTAIERRQEKPGNVQNKFEAKIHGNNENFDVDFLNACQKDCIRSKLIGYLGCEKFVSSEMKILMINSLKKDVIDTFSHLKEEDAIQKGICQRHNVIKIENVPLNTKIALHYILSSSEEDIHIIKNDFKFICDPIYLILFYNLWGNELQSEFDDSCTHERSENRKITETNLKGNEKPQRSQRSEKKNTRQSESLSSTISPKKLEAKTIADIFEERGFRYPFKNYYEKKLKYEMTEFNIEKYTKYYFSLQINRYTLQNEIYLIKLQILLRQNTIHLTKQEIDFLLASFQKSKCFFTKTLIIEVLTKTDRIEYHKKCTSIIFSMISFNGIYSLTSIQLSLLFTCLKFLVKYDLYVKEVNLFLFRLLHAMCPNIVANTLEILKYRKIFRKQVIERCIKLENSDDLSTELLLEYIDRKTYRFSFERLEKYGLLTKNDKKSIQIISKIFEQSNDKFKYKIIKKYPDIAEEYKIVESITNEKVLTKLKKQFDCSSILLLCSVIESGHGFKSPNENKKYRKFLRNGLKAIDKLMKEGKNSQENVNKDVQSTTKLQTATNLLTRLLSIALKFGNLSKNKRIFDYYSTKCDRSEFLSIINEYNIWFDLKSE